MKSLLPLIKTVIAALEADALLDTYMGGDALAFPLEAPDNQALPYITISPIAMTDFSAKDFDGDDIQFQVAAHFERGKAASSNGLTDVGKACERIRDILAHSDGFALDESPSEGETLALDLLTGPNRVSTATSTQLVMCRYISGAIIPGLNDASNGAGSGYQSISGVVRFRALMSPAN